METSNFWRSRKVFVTGCSGFVGSWLTRELIRQGASVAGLIRDVVSESLFFENGCCSHVNQVHGQLEDYQCLLRAINEYDCEVVFHLGAQAIVGIANRQPLSTFESNIRGTYNLLEACRNCPSVKAVVIASSDKSYGSSDRLPYTEDMPLRGTHPYDVSKSCVDLLSGAYFHTYGLPVCTIRWGNTYGGGDLAFDRIVPHAIQHMLHGLRPILRSDGSFVRDYMYVEDATSAYLTLAEKMITNGVKGESFNVADQVRLSVLELVRMIARLAGKPELEPVILNSARGEIKDQFLSCEKAQAMLGWKPVFSINDGLLKTIKWYEEFFADRQRSWKYVPASKAA